MNLDEFWWVLSLKIYSLQNKQKKIFVGNWFEEGLVNGWFYIVSLKKTPIGNCIPNYNMTNFKLINLIYDIKSIMDFFFIICGRSFLK